MPTPIKVVLFEDTAATKSEVANTMQKYLDKEGTVLPFDETRIQESESEKNQMYEERLRLVLTRAPYDSPTLIVADRDLSMISNFRGMSVSAVLEAAKGLGIPICSYARQPASEDYKWRKRWEEGHIVLSPTSHDDIAREAVIAARGFAEISQKLEGVLDQDVGKAPAKALAAVLGKPEDVDKIALYSVGDQNRLSEVPVGGKRDQLWTKRIGCFLGYWLWDSILRYPGLLANEVAAASHLNISPEDFRNPNVQAVFKESLYDGPFADAKNPRWWRASLDDLAFREDCKDGLQLVQKKLKLKLHPCYCSVDPARPAGYYCIISEKPVSLENSKGGLSWFPRGADLTRISTNLFEEYGPWIGA